MSPSQSLTPEEGGVPGFSLVASAGLLNLWAGAARPGRQRGGPGLPLPPGASQSASLQPGSPGSGRSAVRPVASRTLPGNGERRDSVHERERGPASSGARVVRRRLQRGSPVPRPGPASGTGEPGRGRRRPGLQPGDLSVAPQLLPGRPARSPGPRLRPRPCRQAPPHEGSGSTPWAGSRPRGSRGAMASESVKVVVRCRPMNQRERELSCQSVVTVDCARGQCFIQNPGAADEPPKQFTFDGAYYMDHFTEQIYNEIAYPLVEVRVPRDCRARLGTPRKWKQDRWVNSSPCHSSQARRRRAQEDSNRLV